MRNCSIKDCDRKYHGAGYCQYHYDVIVRKGEEPRNPRKPKGNQRYKRITVILGDGTKKRVLEHVFIAEKALGKPLPKGAIVHHLDGNAFNNKNGNLAILPSRAYHLHIHNIMRNGA